MSKVAQQAHYLLLWFLGSDYIHLKQNCSCQSCFFSISSFSQQLIFTVPCFFIEFQGAATSTAAQDPHSSAETQRPSPKRSTTWDGLRRGFFCFFHFAKLPRHRLLHQTESNCFFTSNQSITIKESFKSHHSNIMAVHSAFFQCKSVRSQVFGNSFVKAPLSWGQFHPANMSAVLCPLLSFSNDFTSHLVQLFIFCFIFIT